MDFNRLGGRWKIGSTHTISKVSNLCVELNRPAQGSILKLPFISIVEAYSFTLLPTRKSDGPSLLMGIICTYYIPINCLLSFLPKRHKFIKKIKKNKTSVRCWMSNGKKSKAEKLIFGKEVITEESL